MRTFLFFLAGIVSLSSHAVDIRIKKSQFPSAKKLDKIEKAQAKVLKCVRTLVQKRVGSYDAPKIGQKLLLQVMDGNSISNNTNILNQAHMECENTVKELPRMKRGDYVWHKYVGMVNKLPENSDVEMKTKKLIRDFEDRAIRMCKLVGVEAEAYIALGGGAGSHYLKCLREDGRIVKFIGLHAKVGMGAGAMAGYINLEPNESVTIEGGNVGAIFQRTEDHPDENDMAFGIGGTVRFDYEREFYEFSGFKVGLGIADYAETIGGSLRFINGKNRWEEIISKLK